MAPRCLAVVRCAARSTGDPLHIPYNASCYRKRVYREGGVWWCETTYTPPDRMLVDFQALIAQHMGLPKMSHVRAYPQKQPPYNP